MHISSRQRPPYQNSHLTSRHVSARYLPGLSGTNYFRQLLLHQLTQESAGLLCPRNNVAALARRLERHGRRIGVYNVPWQLGLREDVSDPVKKVR